MDPADVDLRNATYRRFVELGRAPAVTELAEHLGRPADDIRAGWQRLQAAHAIVLDASGELRMANPFAAQPTPFRVEAAGRSWYANCAWDAFGIGAALGVDSRIDTACADCNDAVSIDVRGGRPDDDTLLFHVLVPAVTWWQDIGFT